MLGKPVITCDLTGIPSDFIRDNSDELAIVSGKAYEEFASKILFVLDNLSDERVVRCYARLREAVGGEGVEDAPCRIAEIIRGALERLEA